MSEGSGVGGGLVLAFVVLGTGAGGLIAWQNGMFAPAAPKPDAPVTVTASDTPSAAVRQESPDTLGDQTVTDTSTTTTPPPAQEDLPQAETATSEPKDVDNASISGIAAPKPDAELTQAPVQDPVRPPTEQDPSDQTSTLAENAASAPEQAQADPSNDPAEQPELSETHSSAQHETIAQQTESTATQTDPSQTKTEPDSQTESLTSSTEKDRADSQTDGSPGDEARQSPSALPDMSDTTSTAGTSDSLPTVQDDPAQVPSFDTPLPTGDDLTELASNTDAAADAGGDTIQPSVDPTPEDNTTTKETQPTGPADQSDQSGGRAATQDRLDTSETSSPSNAEASTDTIKAPQKSEDGEQGKSGASADGETATAQEQTTAEVSALSPGAEPTDDGVMTADPQIPADSTSVIGTVGTDSTEALSGADSSASKQPDVPSNTGQPNLANGDTTAPDATDTVSTEGEAESVITTGETAKAGPEPQAPANDATGSVLSEGEAESITTINEANKAEPEAESGSDDTDTASPNPISTGEETTATDTVTDAKPFVTGDASTPDTPNETEQNVTAQEEERRDDANLADSEARQPVEVITTKSGDDVKLERDTPASETLQKSDTSDIAGSGEVAGTGTSTELSDAPAPSAETPDVTDLALLAPALSTEEANVTATPDPQTTPPVRDKAPRFDQVRFDPAGFTVIAGRAHPRVEVAALLDGQIQDVTFTDGNGQFAMLLLIESSPVARVLSLRVYQDGSEIDSIEQVILAPTPAVRPQLLDTTDTPAFAQAPTSPPSPATPQTSTPGGAGRDIGPSRLATAQLGAGLSDEQPDPKDTPAPQPTPGGTARMDDPAQGGLAPTAPVEDPMPSRGTTVLLTSEDGIRVLQTPEPPGAPPETSTSLSLQTIAYDEQGEVSISGRGTDSTFVRIYLNNKAVSQLAVDQDGSWTAELQGIDTGIYTLRVDQISESGDVLSRVESPFKREDRDILARARELTGPIKAITIQPGNTLWGISRERYGRGVLYVHVYEANRDLIRDPDLIYPGQVFDLPETVPDTVPDVLP